MITKKGIVSDAEREIVKIWMKHRAGRVLDIRHKEDATIWMILKRISRGD